MAFLIVFSIYAASVNLAWDPSSSSSVAGYNIYRSTESGNFTSAPLNASLVSMTSFTDTSILSGTYYYVVKAVDTTGQESPASNEVQTNIAPTPVNAAPVTNAGADQTILLPAIATVFGTATDDGLPNGTLTYQWSVISGTGVSIASPNSPSTSLSFSSADTYTLRLTASDGELSSTDDVVLTVNAPLPAPTGLISKCSSDAKSFTVAWNAVPGAESYGLRIDYLANNANGQWFITDGLDYNVDGYNNTTFTASVIANEAYAWWVLGANATTGNGPSSDGTFTCVSGDTTPPTVSITAPSQGAVLPQSPNIAISATASDGVGVVGVQFMVNGSSLGIEDTTAPYSVSWNTKKVPDGTYSIQAVARDAAGNQTISAPVSVTITKRGGTGLQLLDSTTNRWPGLALIRLTNGDTVVSETSAPASEPVREGRVYVNVNGPVNTALALANNDNEPAMISFYFTDGTGLDFGHGSFTLQAKHSLASFLNESPFNLEESMEGTLTFQSSLPIAVTGLRAFTNERGDFLVSTLPITSPVTSAAAASGIVPHFAAGDGWSTQVVLVNPTDTPLEGTLQFFGASSTASSSLDYMVPARASVRFNTAGAASNVESGYVLATAKKTDAIPQALSMFSLYSDGVTITETAVPAGTSGSTFWTYAAKRGSRRSGFAVANSSASSTWITFELLSSDGSSLNITTSMEIPPRGHVARFVDDVFPSMTEGFQGMLRITATQSVGVNSLWFQNNSRGELIITGMPVLNEPSAVDESKLVFPLVANGGGFSTEFVVEEK